MKRFSIVILLLTSLLYSHAQSIEIIKASPNQYIWGEGKSDLLEEADKQALNIIISQISTFVSSNAKLSKRSKMLGNDEVITEDFNSVVKTYSTASLNNTQRIIISDEPNAHVFRYIKRSDVRKVFENRTNKILQFYKNGQLAQKKLQIADALRYYYWSVLLLKSHPYAGKIKVESKGETKILAAWLPSIINSIFSDLKIYIKKINKQKLKEDVVLEIRYKGKKVVNADFKYFTGTDWSNIISANNGDALIEFYNAECGKKQVKIKWEYVFKGEARIDKELELVMANIKRIPFKKAYKLISLKENSVPQISSKILPEKANLVKKSIVQKVDNLKIYKKKLDALLKTLSENEKAEEEIFTERGYKIYKQLLEFGKAKIIDISAINYYKYDNEIVARSASLSFQFKSNNKVFSEKVNFGFTQDGKIDDISFALSDKALNGILNQPKWKEKDKILLVKFMETYKTAYALKQIDFIDKIFAEDALIITGRVVKLKPNKDLDFQNNKLVKYNRQSKKEFIKNLRYSFNSKEYINLKFEDSRIRKSGLKGDVYGINIKQNYYSNNYGDVGYLFLMVDLNNKNEPIIHVRTWQPELNFKGRVFNLADF